MPATLQNPTRLVSVTDAWAKPANDDEKAKAWQAIIGALRGTWGGAEWDGTGSATWPAGGRGYWEKHQGTWSASLFINLPVSGMVTFPFPVVRNIVKIYSIADDNSATQINSYIENSKTFLVTQTGRLVIELSNVRNASNAGI